MIATQKRITQESGAIREVERIVKGMRTFDGDGVNLTRMIGSPQLDMLDPFLLLDSIESDEPRDYLGGFPDHPHRGFETVTYILAGRMRHKDSAGHEGVVEPGGVQWMTAGRGVVHSEMPEQEDGLLKGFQLWVNLPASEKMTDPDYQEYPASSIPEESLAGGGIVRVIAGTTDSGTTGPVKRATVSPLFLDLSLEPGAQFTQRIPEGHNAFVNVIEGRARVGEGAAEMNENSIGVLGAGSDVKVAAGDKATRFLLIAGRPIGEPVARYGPFVMNTKQEILQAFKDFKLGRF